MSTLAVVCVSGGIDSCVTAALAARDHRLAFLHAGYGQRTEAKERACFERLNHEHPGDHRPNVSMAATG